MRFVKRFAKTFQLGFKLMRGPSGRKSLGYQFAGDLPFCCWPERWDNFSQYFDSIMNMIHLRGTEHIGLKHKALFTGCMVRVKRIYELVIRQYMGNTPSTHQHCVTVWATLLYAFHCNWMTAMLSGEPKRLYKGFEERFEKNFKYFTQLDSSGRTRMPMQTAMLFIGMSCTKPTCGALGFCDSFCGECGHGTEVMKKSKATSAITQGFRKDRETAWKKWIAIPKVAALAKTEQSFAAFLKANLGWDKKDVVVTATTNSLQDCWDYLADNQHLVKVRILDDGH